MLADDEEAPDPPLTPHQRKLVKALTPAQIRAIDLALLANISPHWRNVARVVAATMLDVENRAGGIPDVFYAERVKVLVERGTIEAQGDMSRMRLLEVRFAMRSATQNPLKAGSVIDLGNLDASNAVTKSADVEFIDVFSAEDSTVQESDAQASGADLGSGAVSGSGTDASPEPETGATEVALPETETAATDVVDIADRASGSDAPGSELTTTAATAADSPTTEAASTTSTDDVHASGADVTKTDLRSTSDSAETVKAE